MKEPERLCEPLRGKGVSRIGQLEISALDEGFFVYHRDDGGRNDLTNYASDDAFEIAKFDDAGKYRALKTAPNLRHGWKIFVRTEAELERAIEAIYPGRLAVLSAFESDELMTTSLRETLNRQSGMYRIAAKISDQQIDDLVGDFCRSNGGCLRTILWKRDDRGRVLKLPPEKFDPARDQTGRGEKCIPLLCQEACNLLVAACREKVKGASSAGRDKE